MAEPFALNFNLEDWFGRLDLYPGFGVGIATIFLNRSNPKVFPIMNNKTLNALNCLNFKISSTKNFSNYKKVESYQDELISEYPQLQDYYKTDALNHFIVSVPKGKFLVTTYQQAAKVKDTLKQVEIDFIVSDDEDSINVYERIKSCENDKTEYLTVKGKSYKRNQYLCSLIKRYRDYTCQFCSTKLPIANGNHYIEACHIKPKSEGGKDKMDNIIILCPNCHKLFDFADRKNEKREGDLYTVTINDKTYSVSLS